MNPLGGVVWLWRALRGRSVTFAVIFACAVLGVSVFGGLREGLRGLGVPWYGWLIVPGIAIGLLARKERDWWPDEARRLWWTRWIVVAALIGAVVMSVLAPASPDDPRPPPVRPGGPRGK